MKGRKTRGWVLAAGAALALSGCLAGQSDGDAAPEGETVTTEGLVSGETVTVPARATRLVERDVEAPNVFSASEAGLWDGRPSLGGVWVAYPTVKDPERVIIRNPANGKFVIGALFRREREMPGPKLQVSSDAAAALGLLAGQPARLDVTALRREEVAAEPALPPATPALDKAETIATETLPASPTQPAAAAPARPAAAVATPAPAPAAAPAATPARPAAAGGGRNLIQIGIFSVEANANGAAAALRKGGTAAEVKRETSQGKTFWRVVAGPAESGGRDALLAKVRAAGFKDAYFVAR